MFIDNVKVLLSAGKGGDGIIAWRREKYIPKGGPAGGDGGKGGSIFIRVDENLLSLENYRHKKQYKAQNGKSGGPNNQKGKNGENLILKVPPGTLIKENKTGKILYDLTEKNHVITICKGGNGGKGNTQFKSSTNQAPNFSTKGKDGMFLEVELELKLIADVGLIGLPNAGKSTLMKSITKTQVKIAPYPFTTLRPNLGFVEFFDDFSKLLIADIPGIIEKAHQNKGLGFSFLKHIERTSFLIYVIDISNPDPLKDFEILKNELKTYNKEIEKKPYLIVLNKIDIKESKKHIENFKKAFPNAFKISALTCENLPKFLQALKKKVPRNKVPWQRVLGRQSLPKLRTLSSPSC